MTQRATRLISHLSSQFSDVLLYTFRTQQPTQCFRVHGQLPLKGMKIQDADNKTGTDFAFIIDGQGNQ